MFYVLLYAKIHDFFNLSSLGLLKLHSSDLDLCGLLLFLSQFQTPNWQSTTKQKDRLLMLRTGQFIDYTANTVSQEILFNKFSMSSDSEMRNDAQSIISGGRNLLVSVSVTMLLLLPSRVDQGSRYIFCIVVVTCIYERYMKLYFLIQ